MSEVDWNNAVVLDHVIHHLAGGGELEQVNNFRGVVRALACTVLRQQEQLAVAKQKNEELGAAYSQMLKIADALADVANKLAAVKNV